MASIDHSRQIPRIVPRIFSGRAGAVRGPRSLISMLPSLLFSGLLALVITAVTLLSRTAPEPEFFSVWMESWMVAWPIAFPLVYLARQAGRRERQGKA